MFLTAAQLSIFKSAVELRDKAIEHANIVGEVCGLNANVVYKINWLTGEVLTEDDIMGEEPPKENNDGNP